jgi:hypothetical protein
MLFQGQRAGDCYRFQAGLAGGTQNLDALPVAAGLA